jgi:eukaryotic-like serine/threonine-protein kinase
VKSLKLRLCDWEVVARGNLSVCYRARETALDRVVFVKTLNAPAGADPEMRTRFVREARAAARLDHPNLVRLYEFGEDDELGMFMMLEWIESSTLANVLRERGPLDAAELRRLALELFSGLAALHSAGIIHRDFKPENVLIKADGTYKISDFSLAALRDEPRLTHHRSIVGTPAYMSPEQAAGKLPDERSDLFAVGVVLVEAATGTNPFAAPDLIETLRRIRQLDLDFASDSMSAVPESLRGLIQACLEKNRDQRLPSAVDALRLIQPDHHGSALRVTGPSRRKQLFARGAIIFAASLILAGVIWVNIAEPPSPNVTLMPDTLLLAVEEPMASPAEEIHVGSDPVSWTPTGSGTKSSVPNGAGVASKKAASTEPPILHAVADTASLHTITRNPDSVDVWIDAVPWAQVYLEGRHLGTTPFLEPVKIPAGKHKLSFVNLALPRIEREFEFTIDHPRLQVRLAQYVSVLNVTVEPWGNVFVDGERMGTTPLDQPLFILPGAHSLRITHTNLPPVEKSFQTSAGDTFVVSADLDHSAVSVQRVGGSTR